MNDSHPVNLRMVSLVTGGGRGIGRAIAIRLASMGSVLIVGRKEEALQEAQQQINARAEDGDTCEYVVGDLTLPETVEAIRTRLEEKKWWVNSLVLNAGVGKSGRVTEFSSRLFQEIVDVNLLSTLPLLQLVLPEMIGRRQGTICFLSSVAGLKGVAFDAAYSAAKHAQVGFAKSLAQEYGRHGISVVPICPSFVESEMTERTISAVQTRNGISREVARERVEKSSPQCRIIPAEEIAEVVAFVCSGKVPYLSGNPIVLAGGGL